MQNVRFWRTSTQTRPSVFVIFFKYLLLIPATPAATFIMLLPHRGYDSRSDRTSRTDAIIADPALFLIVTLLAGLLLWLWTVKSLSKPIFKLDQNGLKYCGYGFFYSQISFASVKTIKPYRIFPFGTLIDMKSSIGSNVRFLAFVARVKQPELRESLKSTNIKVE